MTNFRLPRELSSESRNFDAGEVLAEGSGNGPRELERSGIERLVQAALKGERQAVEQLVEKLRPRVAGFVQRMMSDRELAEDLLQEVMLALFAALPNYDPDRSFWPWFDVLSRNTVIQELRKMGRAFEVIADPDDIPDPDSTDSKYAETLTLLQAVRDLPKDQGRAVALHVYSDLTFEEIGRLTGMSPNTWSSRYRRARQLLRERLGDSW